MITAKEAKKITDEKLSAADESALAQIDSKIRLAARCGHSSIYVNDLDISRRVEARLKELGFNYEDNSSQRDGDCKTVSW